MPEDFHGRADQTTYRVLQKLQQYTRANIPALLAQRAMSTFTLQQDPMPHAASDLVPLVVYPQNPFVGEPEIRRMAQRDIGAGLKNERIQIQDTTGVIAEPDEEGAYMYWPGSPQFDQVNAFYYATFTLRLFERYAHRAIPWAFPAPRLLIDAHVGSQANAFYNEQERLLGFHTFVSSAGHEISTAQSADVVVHETAHAVLDGLRDLYNESFGLGPRAFHESFGDMAAILVALNDDSLIHRVLQWTGQNLRTTNFISEVAEHLVNELQGTADHTRQHTIYLRNAFNTLKAIPFDDLPFMPDDPLTQLSRQEHNYSRLFTGAFYDILSGVFDHMKAMGKPAFIAVHRARDVMGHLLVTAVELGPVGEMDFSDMARAFLTADAVLYDGMYREILRDVFSNRLILGTEEADAHLRYMSTLPDVRLPASLNNALAAALFLQETVLPALDLDIQHELIPLSTYRNAEGLVYLTFFASVTTRLRGDEYQAYNGVDIDLFGGLTLLFDAENRLRSVVYRPVTQEDIRQVKITVRDMIAHNQIARNLYAPRATLEPYPEALLIPSGEAGEPLEKGTKLIKYPAIFDALPDELHHLADYLQKW